MSFSNLDVEGEGKEACTDSFGMGERVEARLSAEHEFRSAIIVGVHRNGLYDVTFDDNGKEGYDISPNHIRKLYNEQTEAEEGGEGVEQGSINIGDDHEEEEEREGGFDEANNNNSNAAFPQEAESFEKGETVEVMREGGTDWRLAVVSRVHQQGEEGDVEGGLFYDVIYSDKFKEEKVLPLFMRRMYASSSDANDGNLVQRIRRGSDEKEDRQTVEHSRAAYNAPDVEANPFSVGQRVEVRYHGGKLYYSGSVSRVVDSQCVDIRYDDGDSEEKVAVEFVCPLALAPAPSLPPDFKREEASAAASAKYVKGDKVEGNFQGKGRWYPGTVEGVKKQGGAVRYIVLYHDGDREENVAEDMLRPPGTRLRLPSESERGRSAAAPAVAVIEPVAPAKPPSQQPPGNLRPSPHKQAHRRVAEQSNGESSAVQSPVREVSNVAEAKALRYSSNPNLYNSPRPNTANGSSAKGTPQSSRSTISSHSSSNTHNDKLPARIPFSTPQSTPAKAPSPTPLLSKIRVNVNYKGLGQWMSGRILKETVEGLVDILYDHNNEVECDVPVENIQLLSYDSAPSAGASAISYGVGDKIEANYQGQGVYYPGEAASAVYFNRENKKVIDVKYSDGDFEAAVPVQNVKFIQKLQARSSAGKKKAQSSNGASASPPSAASASTSLSLGSLVEVSVEGKSQLGRIIGIFFDSEELFDVKILSNGVLKRGLRRQELRLPRSSRVPDQTPVGVVVRPEELQALKALLQQKDQQIKSLKSQHKSEDDSNVRRPQKDNGSRNNPNTSAAAGISPSKSMDFSTPKTVPKSAGSNTTNPSPLKAAARSNAANKNSASRGQTEEMEALKEEILSLRKSLGALGQKFSLVVGEVVALKQGEEKLKRQVMQQAEHLRTILTAVSASDKR